MPILAVYRKSMKANESFLPKDPPRDFLGPIKAAHHYLQAGAINAYRDRTIYIITTQ